MTPSVASEGVISVHYRSGRKTAVWSLTRSLSRTPRNGFCAPRRTWTMRSTQHDLMATPPFVRDALFHCQQAVEKAMKALLTWHDSAFRKTHNLEELGELCTRIDGTLAPAMEDVTPLTEYAARFRYPGAPWEPTLQEAQESIEIARDIRPHHAQEATTSHYQLRRSFQRLRGAGTIICTKLRQEYFKHEVRECSSDRKSV